MNSQFNAKLEEFFFSKIRICTLAIFKKGITSRTPVSVSILSTLGLIEITNMSGKTCLAVLFNVPLQQNIVVIASTVFLKHHRLIFSL